MEPDDSTQSVGDGRNVWPLIVEVCDSDVVTLGVCDLGRVGGITSGSRVNNSRPVGKYGAPPRGNVSPVRWAFSRYVPDSSILNKCPVSSVSPKILSIVRYIGGPAEFVARAVGIYQQ